MMKNYVHEIAQCTAAILISAMPFSVNASVDPLQSIKPAAFEISVDGDASEPPLVGEQDE
ncbi:hypothetical protein HC024_03225 [Methylococcaceae bacterium WWC4]|nr:hypothetical protein [Methylococcaceae bacterium WWC4]